MSRLAIPLVAVIVLAFACGPRSHSEASPAAFAAREIALVQQQGSATGLSSNFDVAVDTHTVRFALIVTNASRKNVELRFPSGQTHEFVVLDSVGRVVWRWTDGRLFTQGTQNRNLGGGKALKVAEEWTGPARHGRYVAVATLNSANFPVEQRMNFVLP